MYSYCKIFGRFNSDLQPISTNTNESVGNDPNENISFLRNLDLILNMCQVEGLGAVGNDDGPK